MFYYFCCFHCWNELAMLKSKARWKSHTREKPYKKEWELSTNSILFQNWKYWFYYCPTLDVQPDSIIFRWTLTFWLNSYSVGGTSVVTVFRMRNFISSSCWSIWNCLGLILSSIYCFIVYDEWFAMSIADILLNVDCTLINYCYRYYDYNNKIENLAQILSTLIFELHNNTIIFVKMWIENRYGFMLSSVALLEIVCYVLIAH